MRNLIKQVVLVLVVLVVGVLPLALGWLGGVEIVRGSTLAINAGTGLVLALITGFAMGASND